jgi:hypothetical protein
MGSILTIQLVKWGVVRELKKHEFLYRRTSELQGLGVILSGKLVQSHILDNYVLNLKEGDVLAEELILDEDFVNQETITSFGFARALRKSLVLVISAKGIRRIREQIGKGLTKQDLHSLDTHLRRAHLFKKSLKKIAE